MSGESGAVREWGPEFDDVIGVVQSRALSIEDAWAVLAAARPAIEREAKVAALREAAGLYSHMYPSRGAGMPVAVVTVLDLDARADRIEAGGSDA